MSRMAYDSKTQAMRPISKKHNQMLSKIAYSQRRTLQTTLEMLIEAEYEAMASNKTE